ncbi:hypothetical protein HD806DRAFT_518463 [Xylariaceae sp. AK1471]|nr:hypothetical protein HD806DRAFT_518463 [Xylariaceae sp. AK1471]
MAVVGGLAPFPDEGPNPIPVRKDTVRRMSGPNVMFDYNDIQVAYFNLGLDSRRVNRIAPKPTRAQIRGYIRRLVWFVTQPAPVPGEGRSEKNRRKKVDICLMAIQTLRQYKNPQWDRNDIIFVQDTDRAMDARDWAGVPVPMNYANLQVHLNNHRANIGALRAAYESRYNVWVTTQERNTNYDQKHRELARYWDAFPLPGYRGGFVALDSFDVPRRFRVVNFSNDGNSLWNCLAYATYPDVRNGIKWSMIKYFIWRYFNYVIFHPSHPRHRLYVILQQMSPYEKEWISPGITANWGKMTILRALHANKPDSGPPMYGGFCGMFQVIADFFQKEVVLFIRPDRANAEEALLVPGLNDRPRYRWDAFGSRAHGLNRGQLLLVTDRKWEQFQIVTHIDGIQLNYNLPYTQVPAPPTDPDFDTTNYSTTLRYGWIPAPWSRHSRVFYTVFSKILASFYEALKRYFPAPPLLPGYAPIQLARIPFLDPRWTSLRRPHGLNQFLGGGDAASHALMNDYFRGFEPNLPNNILVPWAVEWPPPPHPPPYPYPQGPERIVSGVYFTGAGILRWPRWNNIKAYEAYEYQERAKRENLPTERHPLSQ